MMSSIFLFLGMAMGWILNILFSEAHRVSEIKKIREELINTTKRVISLEKQLECFTQKEEIQWRIEENPE